MASNRIKGITIEIDGNTTKLDKALAGTDKQLKQTQNSLKDVERLLKMDPGNVELLTQKQRLLTEAVEGTRERLRTLETAAEQANEALANGEMSQDQYDALNREIIETQRNLEELTRTANDFDIDQAIQDAEDALRDLSNQADDASGDTTDGFGALAEIAKGTAIAIGEKLVDAVFESIEATEELRIAMGKLNTAFEVAGYSVETAKNVFSEFYKILGDIDTATEASQLLANMVNREEELTYLTGLLTDEFGVFASSIPVDALIQAAAETARTGEVTGALAEAIERAGGNTEIFEEKLRNLDPGNTEGLDRLKVVSDELSNVLFENSERAEKASNAFYELGVKTDSLSAWTNIAAGVYATFGDALPIEGLIEAANETAKTGQVTGVLADALNWVGMSEDEFNESLKWTVDEGDRARLIMNNLAIAYGDAADKFSENNETISESREATLRFQEAIADLAESAQPLLTTLTEMATAFMNWFNDLPDGAKAAVVGIGAFLAIISPISGIITAITGALAAAGIASTTFSIAGMAVSVTLGQWAIIIAVVIAAVLALAAAIAFLTGRGKELKNMEMPDVPDYSGAVSPGNGRAYSLRPATAENLPYLAQGTVTRPNSPFMAVVGDNPNEPEIVSPLSTIEQAVRNVMGSVGGQASNIRVTVNFTGSAAQMVRMLQPQIVAETNRLGPQLVT